MSQCLIIDSTNIDRIKCVANVIARTQPEKQLIAKELIRKIDALFYDISEHTDLSVIVEYDDDLTSFFDNLDNTIQNNTACITCQHRLRCSWMGLK